MNDLISVAFFVGCLLSTFGLVRVCDWLQPVEPMQRPEHRTSRNAAVQHRENGQ
jgi:hypothetical protein